ncbi:THO complex subunit 3 isoform 2-T2 [Theristicus caerulescens]
MSSRQPDAPALEQGGGARPGKMSLPVGVPRRAFSYDDALEDTAPMTPPPADLCANVLWKQPVIPERKYQELSKIEEGDANMNAPVITPSSSTESVNKVPVVKAKATHIIMNSLITKQTQESIQRFEQQAGLRDAGYTPHKGLTTEETKYHRVAEAVHVKENNYRGHGDSVDQLCWHPSNPDLFVTASGDKTIRIWDVRTTKCIATVNTKGENINICWSPDGQTIAVGNKDDVVTFIDAKTHRSKAEEQFKFEVNEISWNNDNNMFFLTNGNGCINILSYPELKPIQSINAHPSNCICIKFDPMGKYFATGSADALVSLWDVDELVCVRCFSRLDWPVRTLSFSHDGKMLASASEDHFIDIAEVETGEKLWEVQCESPTFTVAWHPKRPLLAFACDDKDGKYDSSREAGTVKLFGLPNDS